MCKLSNLMYFTLILGVSFLAVGAIYAEEEPTYAERLGWPEGARVVIFHNDDAGLCHEANIASIRGVEEGLITSWSVMMPCAWVSEIRDYLKDNPEVCSGLHMTLTCEWDKYRWRPVACADNVPGLLDADGYMWGDVSDVAKNATADEFEMEIRAQIALAERMGLPISHLDTHMGTVLRNRRVFATLYYCRHGEANSRDDSRRPHDHPESGKS
jgi:chitin disaccharide deacetylase